MIPRNHTFRLLLIGLLLAGCGKTEQQAASTSQPASASADDTPTAPKVGLPVMTREQYKPVVGKYGGRLVRSTMGEPKVFNPITQGETSSSDYNNLMFEALTNEDPYTGEILPGLAESWKLADDGLTWTFNLRKDVTFTDGTPFTAADVVFVFNDCIYDLRRPAGKEPRWPCSMRDSLTVNGKIIKVEQVDDYTVRFTTPVKFAPLASQLNQRLIISKKKYEPMVLDGSFGGAMSTDSKPQDIVGTGPWILSAYVRGQSVTLKRNPNYWRKDAAGNRLPYLDEQVWLGVRDINAMLLNFQQKITDTYYLFSGKDVPVLKPRQQEDNFTLYQVGPEYSDLFLSFNMNLDAAKAGKFPEYKVKWFRDTRFRQAASYAVDRRALVQNVLRGMGYPETSPYVLNPGTFYYPEFKPYPHDVEKAKALLAEMGLKDTDGDGFLDDGQGHKVAFTLTTNSENTVRVEMIDFIRKDLQKVGMDVNLLPLSFNLLMDKLNHNYDWEAMVMGMTGTREPHDGANIWLSSGWLNQWWPNQKTPSTTWEKQIDDIFAAGVQEMDPMKRKDIYRQWLQIVHEQQPVIYLTVRERVIGLRNKFGNIFPSPWSGLGAQEDALLHNDAEIFVK